MERLARVSGDTVELIEPCGAVCVRVDRIPTSHELGLTAPIGRSRGPRRRYGNPRKCGTNTGPSRR